MSYAQGFYKVIVAGLDVTSNFEGLLEDLSVEKQAGANADSAQIQIADPGGRVAIPAERADVQIFLNGFHAFEGFVSEVSCGIDKGGGRTMSISCSSMDQGSKAKQPNLKHKDDATLSSVASEWGSKAGLQMQVLGSIASVQREYWHQQNESFVSWAQRIAREVGGTFKVVGKRGFLVGRNEGISASGRALTPIAVVAGVNLISGEVQPIITRPKYNKAAYRYFDVDKGEHVEVEQDTPVKDVEAKIRSVHSVYDEDQAKQKGTAAGKETDRDKGGGTVTIFGDARAEPEAICTIAGWKSGVDGSYRIHSVSHKLSKGGFQTTIGLRQPQQ